MIVLVACGCILPIVAILAVVRKKMNDTNQRTQIVLAAIEKNSETDIEEILKKISPKPKLLKEKLLTKLLWGCLAILVGIGFIGTGAWMGYVGGSVPDKIYQAVFYGLIALVVGIPFLVNYFVGKKMLSKEIEAEERRMAEHQ
ncbi:MAG: hypothetical protein IJV05_02890 [Muribaculaceae bacterium]|nr:hypothetical protein [Muribaculaceae bacterium]